MIHLTLDTDWAPESMVAAVLQKLATHNIPATIFATGPYDCLLQADPKLVQVGLHPAVRHIDDLVPAIKSLLAVYPNATAVRTHCLAHASKYWRLFFENGIKTSSNIFLPGCHVKKPIHYWPGITEHPITFMDDYRITLEGPKMCLADIDIDTDGLRVIAFHFIHIYLNSSTLEDYNKAKPFLHDEQALAGCIRPGFGVAALFEELLMALRSRETGFLVGQSK
jgi:hypothetical protein